jgi:sigma-B regulation protein RsbU (phosphoserine phosphatase)
MSVPHQDRHVLVVDDDLTTNRMLQGILVRGGFRVSSAFNAADAMTRVAADSPDLILLDVNLPDGNGLDVCRRLREGARSGHIPILFISSDDEVATKVKGFEAGAVDYIPKPFAGEEVLARVGTQLRLKRAYESLAELQAERIQRLASAQEMLMPQPSDFPEARFQICLNQVLSAGGDFYDVMPVGQQIVDYVVADASGHDLASSFWTASLKSLLSTYADPASSPREVLRSINGTLCRILPQDVFFTMIYARLNRHTGKLMLVNAGHPPAVIVGPGRSEPTVVRQEGDLIGAFPDVAFDCVELPVRRGDRLVLCSDGLIELHGDWQAGQRTLAEVCHAHRQAPLGEMVQSVVREITCGARVEDDIVLMGVEV